MMQCHHAGEVEHQLYLYSGHDTTIMPLLRALGLDVEHWPGYLRYVPQLLSTLTRCRTCAGLLRLSLADVATHTMQNQRCDAHSRPLLSAATWCLSSGSGLHSTAAQRPSTECAYCTTAKC